MNKNIWHVPPTTNRLAEQEVHIWRAELNVSPVVLESYQAILSAEEADKARRFYFEKDRRHWTVARGVLKRLLGSYMQQEPRTITFQYNAYGKPALTGTQSLQFNISHSHELALYAFTNTQPIGIDVEYMRSNIDYTEIAEHSFSAAEQAEFRSISQLQRSGAFFKGWTSKEAYIKGRGMGLSLPLHLFDTSLDPQQPAALLASREESQEEHWSLHTLSPGPGYAGALAIAGSVPTIHCWQWMHV